MKVKGRKVHRLTFVVKSHNVHENQIEEEDCEDRKDQRFAAPRHDGEGTLQRNQNEEEAASKVKHVEGISESSREESKKKKSSKAKKKKKKHLDSDSESS